MTEQELNEVLQSDMKLWETAETTMDGDTVTKMLDLPYGIGEYIVTIEGVTDAEKRRAAVTGFAESVRDVVRDKIDDDAITARAQQAAARASEATDSLLVEGGIGSIRSEKISDSQTVQAHVPEAYETGKGGANTVDGLRARIEATEAAITLWRKELKALEAYEEIMNAPEIQSTPNGDSLEENS